MNRSIMILSVALLTLSLSVGAALAEPFSSGAIAMKIRPLLAGHGVAVAGEGSWDETNFAISRGKGELRGHLRIGGSHYLLRNVELVESEQRDVAPEGEEPAEGEAVKTFTRIDGFSAEIHALPEPEPKVMDEVGETEELDFDGLAGAAGEGDEAAVEEENAPAENASLGRIEVRIVLRGEEKPRRLLEGTASLDGVTWTLMARPALPPMMKKPLVWKAKKKISAAGIAAASAAETEAEANTAEDGF